MEGTPRKRGEAEGTPKRRNRPSLGQPVRMKAKRTPRAALDETFDNVAESSAPRGAATPPSSKRPASARQHLIDSGSCSKSASKAAQRSLFGRPPPASECYSSRKSLAMPVGDKNYTKTCADDVFEFLNTFHFGRGITPDKVFKGVSTRDFFDMFQFIYHKLDPDWVFDGKPEDDIPMIMKIMGYPTDVNKSKLLAISGPNAWPQLLAILQFLVHRHAVWEAYEEAQDEKLATSKKRVSYCMDAYDVWVAEGDAEVHLQQRLGDMKESLQQRLVSMEEGMVTLNAAIAEKESNINELESSKTAEQVRAETNSLQNTVSSEVRKDELVQQSIKSESQMNEEIEKENEDLKQELASILDTVKNQPYTVNEVEQYRHEIKATETRIKEKEADNRRIEKEIAEMRKQYTQKVQEWSLAAQKHNNQLEEMAAHANFKEFADIDPAEFRVPDDCLSNEAEVSKIFTAIQAFTKAVKPEIGRAAVELQNQIYATEQEIRDKTDQYDALACELKNRNEDLMAIMHDRLRQREIQQEEQAKMSAAMRSLSAQVRQLEMEKSGASWINKEINAATAKLEDVKREGARLLKEMDDAIVETSHNFERLMQIIVDDWKATDEILDNNIDPQIDAISKSRMLLV